MKNNIKISQFAKKLVELSKEEGFVTETKVFEVLKALKQKQPRYYLKILKTFLGYIRREVTLQTAVVSTPANLSEASLKSIETHFTKEYDRPINAVLQKDDSLIAGVRIRVGDDVYDASVAGHLRRLCRECSLI